MRATQGGEWTFTGRHMVLVMVAFFGVTIAVNLLLAFFATSSWTGLVVKNSYVASQTYNEKLAEVRAQEALGWGSSLQYQAGELTFALQDEAGVPLSSFEVTVMYGRPAHESEDTRIALHESAPGRYAAEALLLPGVWNAEVTAVAPNGRVYRKLYRLTVSSKG